jgi:hypothetical protein
MLAVDIHCLEGNKGNCEFNKIGTIAWDGKQYVLEPEASRPDPAMARAELQTVIDDPIFVGNMNGGWITSREPERFLEGLHFQYHSPYFQASRAYQTGDDGQASSTPPREGQPTD